MYLFIVIPIVFIIFSLSPNHIPNFLVLNLFSFLLHLALGSLDITSSFIPQRSTTFTPGSPIPSSTSLREEHPNSSQFTASEMIPTVSSIPSFIPASTLTDLITGSASLEKDNQDGPSELDVGDEGMWGHNPGVVVEYSLLHASHSVLFVFPPHSDIDMVTSPSPLDPLLAGLISIFIVSTALLSIILFLKFRQQSSHPEFRRLQDLPMVSLHYNAFTNYIAFQLVAKHM